MFDALLDFTLPVRPAYDDSGNGRITTSAKMKCFNVARTDGCAGTADASGHLRAASANDENEGVHGRDGAVGRAADADM